LIVVGYGLRYQVKLEALLKGDGHGPDGPISLEETRYLPLLIIAKGSWKPCAIICKNGAIVAPISWGVQVEENPADPLTV
jgi:hypothetical protein